MDLIEDNFNKMQNSLSEGYFAKIGNIKEDLLICSNKQIDSRTDSQLKYSVLNDYDCPTIDAKYWQMFRELKSSFNSVLFSSINIETLLLELEELDVKIEKINEDIESYALENAFSEGQYTFEFKMANIQLKKLQLQKKSKLWDIETTKANTNHGTEEILRIHAIWKDLKSKLKYSSTDPNEHQIEAILKKCIYHLEIEFSKGKVGMAEIYNLIGHLKSFKRAAIENNIYEKIKEDLTERQILILEEKFDYYDTEDNSLIS